MISLSRSDSSLIARWWWTIDRWNLIQILALAAIGVIMVWASSPPAVERITEITNSNYFLKRHVLFLFIGIILMLFLSIGL